MMSFRFCRKLFPLHGRLLIRTIFPALVFTLFGFTVRAINKDSLWNIWSDTGKHDTIRLAALDEMAWEGYGFSRPDSAYHYAGIAYAFAREKGYTYWMAKALNTQGNSLVIRSEYFKAYETYENSLELFEKSGDRQGIANTLHRIGIIYFYQGDYARALDHYLRALEIREETGDKKGIGGSYNNIGIVHSQQKNYSQALDYFSRSLALCRELNDKRGEASAINNIGLIYKSTGDLDKALDYYQQSLRISESLGDKRDMATTLHNMSSIIEELGDMEQAYEILIRSVKLKESVGDKQSVTVGVIQLGLLSYKLHKFTEAIDWCEKGLQVADEIGALPEQQSACECLYLVNKARGNETVALAYHERMLDITDSLNQAAITQKLEQLEFTKQIIADSLARAEERMKIKQAHEAEVRRKNVFRNVMLAVISVMAIGAAGLFSRIHYIRKSSAEIAREKARSESLLLNILPREIAQELKDKGEATSRRFDNVSILFTDFKEFTHQSSKLSPEELVSELNGFFKTFDKICEDYRIEKIKTIGDAYMAAGGIPLPAPDSVINTVLAAIAMTESMAEKNRDRVKAGKDPFEMRVGIHTGPVVAGIVGAKKFQYDIWGDTVNIASRMESTGETGKVNISKTTYDAIHTDPRFLFHHRGCVEVKGRGEIEMYFVTLKENAGSAFREKSIIPNK